ILLSVFILDCSRDHRALHSFPTRRSSDLQLELAGIQDPAQIEIVERESADYMAGSVISQNVAAGEGMDFDSTITLTVSTGAEERSEEHTSELQSRFDLVCRLLLEKKNIK